MFQRKVRKIQFFPFRSKTVSLYALRRAPQSPQNSHLPSLGGWAKGHWSHRNLVCGLFSGSWIALSAQMLTRTKHSWVNNTNTVGWTTQTFSIKFCSVLKYVSISPMLKAVASSCHKHSCKKIVQVYLYGKFYAHTYWWLPFWNVFLVRLQTRILMKVAFIHSRNRNDTMWQITLKNAALVASI